MLVTAQGAFRRGYNWLIRLSRTVEGVAQIEIELRAQIEQRAV